MDKGVISLIFLLAANAVLSIFLFLSLFSPLSFSVPVLTRLFFLNRPIRVALQVGHWQTEKVPKELASLKESTGTFGAGKMEWEVNMAIAQQTAKILRSHGIRVDILPTTIPVGYTADVFVAIHSDGNPDSSHHGFKVVAPVLDITQKGKLLAQDIRHDYQKITHLPFDTRNITTNMTWYYAFNFIKFKHAISPHTVSAIIETGYLTNPSDQLLIVYNPQKSADGIASGILDFLQQ